MKKSNEFNDISAKNSSVSKSKNTFVGNFSAPSANKIETTDATKVNNENARYQKTKETAKKTSSLITKVAAVAATAVLGVTGVQLIVPETINAQFEEVYVYETGVYFHVSLNEMDDDVYVVLYNDFTSREEKIEEQQYSGYFEGLAEHMYYTLALKKGNTLFLKQTIYTQEDKSEYEEYDDTGQDYPQTSDDPVTEDPTQGN